MTDGGTGFEDDDEAARGRGRAFSANRRPSIETMGPIMLRKRGRSQVDEAEGRKKRTRGTSSARGTPSLRGTPSVAAADQAGLDEEDVEVRRAYAESRDFGWK